MKNWAKALAIFACALLFYLLTGNGDLAFFGLLLVSYFEFRVASSA